MGKRVETLQKIKNNIANTDIYELAELVKTLLDLYYTDTFFGAIKGSPFLAFSNSSALIYFVKNINELYNQSFDEMKELYRLFENKILYICFNEDEFDVDLVSAFPHKRYIGLAKNNILQIIEILLFEETLLKEDKVCPYCGSRSLKYHPFIKSTFFAGKGSYVPEKTVNTTEVLNDKILIEDSDGIFLSCRNCGEFFNFNSSYMIPTKFKYKTKISKKTFYDYLSLVCGDDICKIQKTLKSEVKSYYKEDLDEIIEEYYDKERNKDIKDFLLYVKNNHNLTS